MKPIQLLSVILLMMYNTGYSQISKSQIPAQKPAIMDAPFLLKTNWDQWGIYAKYTPENHVLGCWSTAMAQILYYHRLEPSGIVSYTCSKGYVIKDNLSHYFPVWNHFTESINNHSNPETIDAVARYSYLTALAVRKDFGTSRYLEMINPAPQIEKHFTCKAVFYGSFTGDVPFHRSSLKVFPKKKRSDISSIKTVLFH